MQIQAAVVRARQAPMSLENLELAPVGDGDILVRVVATGVCHTDIAMRDQAFPVPQPIVLGHEGAGVVEAVGRGVTRVRRGDHVIMTFNSCGACPSCAAHAASYCHHFFEANFSGTRADGSSALSAGAEKINGRFFGQSSFATHAICTERNVVRVPLDVDLALLGPLACGIQTGAGAIINVLRPAVGQSLAVFGAGSVGMAAILAARAIGVTTIIAVDLLPARLKMARELGATHVIDPAATPDVLAQIHAATGAGVDVSFETTGVMSVLRTAVLSLAPRGACGFVGAVAPGTDVSLDVMDIMTQGKTLRGIVEGDANPEVFIPALISLYRQGRFPFDRLISFYPFARINDAIADAEQGRVIKPVLRMPP